MLCFIKTQKFIRRTSGLRQAHFPWKPDGLPRFCRESAPADATDLEGAYVIPGLGGRTQPWELRPGLLGRGR